MSAYIDALKIIVEELTAKEQQYSLLLEEEQKKQKEGPAVDPEVVQELQKKIEVLE